MSPTRPDSLTGILLSVTKSPCWFKTTEEVGRALFAFDAISSREAFGPIALNKYNADEISMKAQPKRRKNPVQKLIGKTAKLLINHQNVRLSGSGERMTRGIIFR